MSSTTQAVTKVRDAFRKANRPLLFKELKDELQDLKPSSISMTLCYLAKQRYATRELITNPTPKCRKAVWRYTYYDKRMEAPAKPAEVTA